MLATNAALYLPVSDRILGPIIGDSDDFVATVSGLAVPQIAALILLQCLPKLKNRPGPVPPDRILAESIATGNAQVQKDGLPAFTASALRVLDRTKIVEGYQLLSDFKIALLDDEALRWRGFLTPEGNWDHAFCDRHRQRLTDVLQRVELPSGNRGVLTSEQGRIFCELRAQADDHMHVQGYAGTGKSYLIRSCLSMLQSAGAMILVLAERQGQLKALVSGLEGMEYVHPRTFEKLADEIIPRDLTDPMFLRMRRTNYSRAHMPHEDVASHLGIQPLGEFSRSQLAEAVQSTVRSFCFSEDAEIRSSHIPERYASTFDPMVTQVVLHHATEFWSSVLSPLPRGFRPVVRGYHRIKWAALKRWKIPERYTHILIDECHNLSKPFIQILDESRQAVISLGDEYQNLQGRAYQRSNIVRQRAVTQSVRSGELIEGIVNPIIAAHPGRTKVQFQGNAANRTEILYYDKATIPDQPAVIFVSDTWGLFEWSQRLAFENRDIELLSSRGGLDMFVNDCIELYERGTRPRHGELFRFGTWEALASRYGNRQGFLHIDRMLQKGYTYRDWLKTSSRFVERNERGYSLGVIEDLRNREFDTVMLAPDVVDSVWDVKRATFAAAGSSVYVAVTRARRRLIAPERLRSWVGKITTI